MPLTPEEIRGIVTTARAEVASESACLYAEAKSPLDVFALLNATLTTYHACIDNTLGHMCRDIQRTPEIDRHLLKSYLADAIIATVKSYIFTGEVIRHPFFGQSVEADKDDLNDILEGQAVAASLSAEQQSLDPRFLETLIKFGDSQFSLEDWKFALDAALLGSDRFSPITQEKAGVFLNVLPRPVVESMRFFEMFDEPGDDLQGYVDAMTECQGGVGVKADFSLDVRSFNLKASIFPDHIDLTFHKNRIGVICHQAELKFTDLPTRDLKDYFHYHAAQETPGLTLIKRVELDRKTKTLHLRLAVHAKVKLEKQGITFTGAAAEDFTRNLVSMFLDIRQKWLDRQKSPRSAPSKDGGPT